MRKRRFFILALVLAPFLLPAAFLVEEHVGGKISLAHYQRQLSAQGKKVTPRDFGKATKPGENAAPEIRQAAKQLKAGRVLPKNYLPRMRLLPSGRARVGSRQDYWVEDKVTNHWDDVSADLEQNQELLQSIRAALERPVLNNNVDFSAGYKMTFTHIPIPKSLTTGSPPQVSSPSTKDEIGRL